MLSVGPCLLFLLRLCRGAAGWPVAMCLLTIQLYNIHSRRLAIDITDPLQTNRCESTEIGNIFIHLELDKDASMHSWQAPCLLVPKQSCTECPFLLDHCYPGSSCCFIEWASRWPHFIIVLVMGTPGWETKLHRFQFYLKISPILAVKCKNTLFWNQSLGT